MYTQKCKHANRFNEKGTCLQQKNNKTQVCAEHGHCDGCDIAGSPGDFTTQGDVRSSMVCAFGKSGLLQHLATVEANSRRVSGLGMHKPNRQQVAIGIRFSVPL